MDDDCGSLLGVVAWVFGKDGCDWLVVVEEAAWSYRGQHRKGKLWATEQGFAQSAEHTSSNTKVATSNAVSTPAASERLGRGPNLQMQRHQASRNTSNRIAL